MKLHIATFLFLFLTTTVSTVANRANACQDIKDLKPTSLVFPSLKPIEGRVVDESGWPVAGAVVLHYGKNRSDGQLREALLPPYEVSNRAITDVRGKFKLLPDEYKYPAAYTVFHPKFAMQRLAPLSLYGDIVLTRNEDLFGRILNHDGSPVEGAQIVRQNAPNEEAVGFSYGRTTTDEDGRFELPNAAGESNESMWVTLPGKFQGLLTWYPNDENSNRFSPYIFSAIGNDFEFRLPEICPVEVSVVSATTNEAIEIERAQIAHSPYPDHSSWWGTHSHVKVEGNKVSTQYLRTGGNRIWIHPKPESRHVSGFVDITVKPGEKTPDKLVVKIPEGIRVSGKVVDEVSGLPVENCAVAYTPKEPGKLLNSGVFYPGFVRTNKEGVYSCLLPEVAGELRVVGECQNYKTLPLENFNSISATDETLERLVRSIEPEVGKDLVVPTFKLQLSPKIFGVVVGEDDQPLEDVTYVVQRMGIEQTSTIFGKTDRAGRFEIDSIFVSAIGFPQPGPNVHYSPPLEERFSIFFWHEDLTLSKQVPYNENDLAPMRVKLEASPAAWGRVVDGVSGEPVADVQVSVQLGFGFFSIGARSRGDGTFLIEHLPRKGANAIFRKADYNSASESFRFDPENKKNLILELEDTKITRTFAFGKPETPDDISELPLEEALASVTEYLEKEIGKLPEREPGLSANNPDHAFKILLFNGLTEQSEVLFNASNSQEFKIAAALAILNKFSDQRGGAMIPASPIGFQAQQALIENINREGVFEQYRKLEFGWTGAAVHMQVFNAGQSTEIKKWAIGPLMSELEFELRQGTRVGQVTSSQQHFEKTLQQTIGVWQTALTEFPEHEIYPGKPISYFIQRTLEGLTNQPDGSLDEQRAKIVREAMEALLGIQ